MTKQPRPANKILSALPEEEFGRLRPHLQEVNFKIGEVIYHPNAPIESVYFINRGIVSWLAALNGGNTVEAGVIGREGLAGLPVLFGVSSTPNQALIQGELFAEKISSDHLITAFHRNNELQRLILRFVHSVFTQVAQTAGCNRMHTLDQRLARWLLMTHDRMGGDVFSLTQEFLSRMLGVRRAGVSIAANRLKKQGLIDYHRGDIRVLNRKKLEAASCECYRIVKHEYDERV